MKGEVTFYIPSQVPPFSCNPTPSYEQNCVVNVAINCDDFLTPLHLQAGLHYSRVTQVWCCTWSSLLLMLALLWWYIKRHKLGLYVSHATTPPRLKCTCTPPQWSLARKFIYLYTVPCLYSVPRFSSLEVKSWLFRTQVRTISKWHSIYKRGIAV